MSVNPTNSEALKMKDLDLKTIVGWLIYALATVGFVLASFSLRETIDLQKKYERLDERVTLTRQDSERRFSDLTDRLRSIDNKMDKVIEYISLKGK